MGVWDSPAFCLLLLVFTINTLSSTMYLVLLQLKVIGQLSHTAVKAFVDHAQIWTLPV